TWPARRAGPARGWDKSFLHPLTHPPGRRKRPAPRAPATPRTRHRTRPGRARPLTPLAMGRNDLGSLQGAGPSGPRIPARRAGADDVTASLLGLLEGSRGEVDHLRTICIDGALDHGKANAEGDWHDLTVALERGGSNPGPEALGEPGSASLAGLASDYQ